MQNMNAISAYVLSLVLLTAFLLIFLMQRRSNPQSASLGIASGATGLLLGAIGSYAIVSVAGYDVIKPRQLPEGTGAATPASAPTGGSPSMGGMGGPDPAAAVSVVAVAAAAVDHPIPMPTRSNRRMR